MTLSASATRMPAVVEISNFGTGFTAGKSEKFKILYFDMVTEWVGYQHTKKSICLN